MLRGRREERTRLLIKPASARLLVPQARPARPAVAQPRWASCHMASVGVVSHHAWVGSRESTSDDMERTRAARRARIKERRWDVCAGLIRATKLGQEIGELANAALPGGLLRGPRMSSPASTFALAEARTGRAPGRGRRPWAARPWETAVKVLQGRTGGRGRKVRTSGEGRASDRARRAAATRALAAGRRRASALNNGRRSRCSCGPSGRRTRSRSR